MSHKDDERKHFISFNIFKYSLQCKTKVHIVMMKFRDKVSLSFTLRVLESFLNLLATAMSASFVYDFRPVEEIVRSDSNYKHSILFIIQIITHYTIMYDDTFTHTNDFFTKESPISNQSLFNFHPKGMRRRTHKL